ncbi:MAG: tetratricopeptide repeat protein [Defluviitaleaceae bacterium]|nr:tetratricopeptide repeat protein [Defluviitaleaceae bacterium]
MLQFTLSQQLNTHPYAFTATGIRVYSFEEAMYHVYHYWRESADDLLSDGLAAWVMDLGHNYQAARIKELRNVRTFTERMVGFLRLAPYFDDTEIAALTTELKQWESRREWEQLKERADAFLTRNDPAKAIPLYRRALQHGENVPLLNNLAVAYLRLGANGEAYRLLQRARVMEPNNLDLTLHYAEAAILTHQFDDAQQVLQQAATSSPDSATQAIVCYLHGLAVFEQNDFARALSFFEAAMQHDSSIPLYAMKIADTHLKMRQYDQALTALDRTPTRDEDYYIKQAEIHTACGNSPLAVRAIRQALERNNSAALWTRMAACYRQDYDFTRANEAITKALTLDPDSEPARMENARIKKSMGRTREYQAEMSNILRTLKTRYREHN